MGGGRAPDPVGGWGAVKGALDVLEVILLVCLLGEGLVLLGSLVNAL